MSFARNICSVLCLTMITASVAVADDNVRSVYAVPRVVKGTQADADQIAAGKMETVEERFHMDQAHLRGGTYYEIIHHIPGQADEYMCAVNYDDYQYTTGILKKDYDQMWGDWIYARDGVSIAATGLSLYLAWTIATKLAAKKIFLLSGIMEKFIWLYKSKVGWAIAAYPTYLVAKQIYTWFNDRGDALVKGKEMAERDWLYKVISQSYENAKFGTPIDDTMFDIDAGYNRVHDTLAGKKVEPPKPTTDAKKADASYQPAVTTVPMAKNMDFAVGAFRNFCKNYVEPNAEDDTTSSAPIK